MASLQWDSPAEWRNNSIRYSINFWLRLKNKIPVGAVKALDKNIMALESLY